MGSIDVLLQIVLVPAMVFLVYSFLDKEVDSIPGDRFAWPTGWWRVVAIMTAVFVILFFYVLAST